MVEQDPVLIHRRLPLRRWIPYALFLVGCVLSVAASWYVSASARAQQQTEFAAERATFESDAAQIRQQIGFRLGIYMEVVHGAAALIAASNEISGSEFQVFVRGLQLRERYPGMIGIGFAPRVPARTRAAFQRAVTLDSSNRSFRMWPAGARREYLPVLFFEPIDPVTRASVGFDLWTDEVLREVMERARDTGEPTASGVLSSPPLGRADQKSIVLVIPIYRLGMPRDTVEARRLWLTGFVFSPFDAEAVLDPFMTNETSAVSLAVYDGGEPLNTLLSASTTVRDSPKFESAGHVQIADRNWLVTVKSLEGPMAAQWQIARGTLLAGLVLSFLLLLITSVQVRAWETSARHEAELRASAVALRESEAKAQAADRAKDEFLATLSHELRTPLNAIMGWVSMLRRGSVQPERRGHGLAVIERNARLQARLIEDLLDVSRIVMGKVRLQMGPLVIAPVISGAVESLRPSADAKGVHLHALVAGDPVVIHGDAARIQQVVWNLVANGIKFTPAGGHVHVALTHDDRHARLSVRDTGIGITADFLPHVFERFSQADSSTTRPHSGIGVGLSIVQHLVELHGGSIEVRSEGLDRGAEFVLQFPIAPAEQAGVLFAETSFPSFGPPSVH
jgi:signal transduction histidine kinase